MSSRGNVQQYSPVCGRGSDQNDGIDFISILRTEKISVEFVSIINGLSNIFPFHIFEY